MGVRSRSPLKTGAQFGLSVTSGTVVTLTVPAAAMVAEIYVRTAAVVFTRDASDPTATRGAQANVGRILLLNSRAEMDNFRVIAVSATATLDVEYFTDVNGGPLVAENGIVEGNVAHDAVDSGYPVKIGGRADTAVLGQAVVADGDRVDAFFDAKGHLGVFIADHSNADNGPARVVAGSADALGGAALGLLAYGNVQGLAPDGSWDRLRTARDSAPGLGALNVAPIGGDVTVRASAAMGGNGTSTALDDVGWVRAMLVFLDVTAVPTGGTPTADFYLQTQLASGDWQDIAHFTQVVGSVTSQLLSWGPAQGDVNGTQSDGAAPTVDNFFAEADAALAASTIRLMPLGDSLRLKWVFAAGGSSGDYTFSCVVTLHTR